MPTDRALGDDAGAAGLRGRIAALWRRRDALLGAGASGAAGVFAVRMAGAALGYCLHVALARLLGASEFGVWGFAFALILVAGHAASVGFPDTVVRYLTGYIAQGDWARARGQVIAGACVSMGIGSLIGFAGAAIVLLCRDLLPPNAVTPLLMACAILPVFALQDWMDGASRALRRPMLSMVPIFILRPVVIMGGAAIASTMSGGADAALAMGATIAAMFVTALAQAIAFWRALPAPLRNARAQFEWGAWVRASAPLGVVVLADQAGGFADVIALGFMASPEETGAYFAAARLVALVALGTFAVSVVSGRRFALHHARGESRELLEHVRASTRWTFLGSLLLVLFLAPAGPLLLSLFGRDFMSAAPALTILGCGLLARAACGQAEELLVVTGHERTSARIAIACALLALVSCFPAAELFGVTGVAAAMALTAAIRSFLFIRAARRLTGFNPAVGRDTFRRAA
ncbi:MAG: lipopolysaccharide biosynthesis protein [Beijerinckiaceae bacterium]|nr:lipopolysaccharide biosynthesis protein [Beijerinckiaceae bacterium]